ncbi:MAG: GntR family transcriptional regulator [Nitrospirae bacterium]|nr:GntR family transcriptional regulator [Nitrospirota bacterium]
MLQNEIPQLHIKTIDRFNKEKLYIQLTRIFLDEIRSGNWERGRQIFTEEELCKQYNVSKITVRQAINNLVDEGYLIKVQGKGTFANSELPVAGLVMKTRLTEDTFENEVRAGREVLFKGFREPPPDAREHLKTDGEVFHVLCRAMVGGEPVHIEESFVPREMLPDMKWPDFEHCSVSEVLEEMGAKRIFKVRQTIGISQVYGDSARHLNLQEGEPVIAVHRLFISSDASELAYIRLLGRRDKYKFQIELERIR